MQNPLVSIVIPALNEEASIAKAIIGVREALREINHEIIVVDGNSFDKTASIAKGHGARVLYDGMGKGHSLIHGMSKAKGKIIVSMDADLSNQPKELLLLIDGIRIGYDICMGSRFITGGSTEDMPMLRIVGNKFFVLLVNLFFGSSYSDLCYGYRSFSRHALSRLNLRENGFGIEAEISVKAAKKGLKVMEIPSNEKRRSAGDGKLHTFRDGLSILLTILRNA